MTHWKCPRCGHLTHIPAYELAEIGTPFCQLPRRNRRGDGAGPRGNQGRHGLGIWGCGPLPRGPIWRWRLGHRLLLPQPERIARYRRERPQLVKDTLWPNNYLQFSEGLESLTSEEADWLKHQLEEVPAGKGKVDRPRFLMDFAGCEETDDYDYGFEWRFSTPDATNGLRLWLYAEDNGDPDRVACLVQKFLKKFRPDECWSLTYAATCSKPRVGEFGGGAVFVTADAIRWQNAYEFVEQQRVAFQRNGKPHQGDAEHGKTTTTEP